MAFIISSKLLTEPGDKRHNDGD